MIPNIRNKAKKIFSELGYPSMRNEMWKYTNVKNFNNYAFKNSNQSNYQIKNISLSDQFYNIIICNGQLVSNDIKIKGVNIANYEDLINSSYPIEKFLQISDFNNNGITAHNTSAFIDALHITIDENKKIRMPINIINISSNLEKDKIIFPRVYIHSKKNSSASIYIHHINDGAECAINSVMEFFCDNKSNLNIFEFSNFKDQEFINSTNFSQLDDSKINFLSATFGGKLYRSNIEVAINGEGCDNNFGVLMLGDTNDHIDYHVNINHNSGNSFNNFNCKSLLKDNSIGVFNGKILVEKEAAGTDSKLNNNNLLLSEKSEIQSNPQLEINCEDVKCAHGSTTGNIDKEALFYLRSRGISLDRAKAILIHGFISKLISSFNLDILFIDEKINKWI
tara:strand:+ start:1956 stop:3137 length:1182 start_codon:yes stop_codon:yes gene_type:complete